MGFVSRLKEFAFGDDAPIAREIEPTFGVVDGVTRSSSDDDGGSGADRTSPFRPSRESRSISGVR
jgi:hypothetical protein